MEENRVTVEPDQVVDVDRANSIARLDDGHEVPLRCLYIIGGAVCGDTVIVFGDDPAL